MLYDQIETVGRRRGIADLWAGFRALGRSLKPVTVLISAVLLTGACSAMNKELEIAESEPGQLSLNGLALLLSVDDLKERLEQEDGYHRDCRIRKIMVTRTRRAARLETCYVAAPGRLAGRWQVDNMQLQLVDDQLVRLGLAGESLTSNSGDISAWLNRAFGESDGFQRQESAEGSVVYLKDRQQIVHHRKADANQGSVVIEITGITGRVPQLLD